VPIAYGGGVVPNAIDSTLSITQSVDSELAWHSGRTSDFGRRIPALDLQLMSDQPYG